MFGIATHLSAVILASPPSLHAHRQASLASNGGSKAGPKSTVIFLLCRVSDHVRSTQIAGGNSDSTGGRNGRSTIYRLVGSGLFPKPVRLSLGRVAWRKCDVADWLSRRWPRSTRGSHR